jgi:hypothetical protein
MVEQRTARTQAAHEMCSSRAVFYIDHMNARARYTKTIVAWALELQLTGEVLSQTTQR